MESYSDKYDMKPNSAYVCVCARARARACVRACMNALFQNNTEFKCMETAAQIKKVFLK